MLEKNAFRLQAILIFKKKKILNFKLLVYYNMYKIIVVLILIFILNFFINKNFETFKNIDNEDYFKKKIIFITGSTRGIGLSLAKKLSRYNCKLIINGRNEDRVEQIVNTLKKNGNYISGIAADLSEQENINKLFDKIIDKYGRIDILVNNVIGRYGHKKLSEKKIEDWKKEIDLNVNSIFYISQKVISHMKSKSLHRKIINISSNLSKQRDTTISSGSIILSKNLLERMSEILAHENFENNISVSVIRIDSGNFKSNKINTAKISNPIIKNTYDNINKMNNFFYDDPDTITSMFLDIIKLPHHQLSGKVYSTTAFNENKNLSKIVPSYQILLNKNLFKKYKFTHKKKNGTYIIKQNPYGTSPEIKKFLKKYDVSKSIFNVNTDNNTKLLKSISSHLDISPEQIVVFKTEYDAIKKIFSLFVPKYSNIFTLYPNSEFLELLSNEMKFNIKYTIYKINNNSIQPKFKHIISYITPKTKLVYLSSPNNLTGQSINEKDFVKFIDTLNDNIIIVIDQLYLDFVTKKNIFDPLKYLDRNVIVIRTFSNFYGFENLEISYVIANKDIAKMLDESNIIQNQTDILNEEIAIQCLKDKKFTQHIKNNIYQEKNRLYKIFEKENINYFPSETNYILIDPKKNKENIMKELEENNIVIEESDLHYNNYWALPISTKENNDQIIDILISNF